MCILKFGLWMNKPTLDEAPCIHGEPSVVPRTCFTELKLSEVEKHAGLYGRLGVGFKRPFVVDRGGMPVWYYPHWSKKWPDALGGVGDAVARVRPFLRPMGTQPGRCSYDLLDESEWRIVHPGEANWARRPHAGFREDYDKFCAECLPLKRPEPDFLIPLEDEGRPYASWLALIIYPDIGVRLLAERDCDLQAALLGVKDPREPPRCLWESHGTAQFERFMKPMQIGLDDCRNF
jgi:hypothetical protein